MDIVHFKIGDKLLMKKKHPCGSNVFSVKYSGTDIKISCDGCGHDIIIPREKLEKNIKKVLPK